MKNYIKKNSEKVQDDKVENISELSIFTDITKKNRPVELLLTHHYKDVLESEPGSMHLKLRHVQSNNSKTIRM